MPSFSILNDISKELQTQIVTSLGSAPDISFAVSNDTIVLEPPSEDLDDSVLASLYLYHLSVDPHLLNQSRLPAPSDPGLSIRPPLPLIARFLFVPLSDEAENNQLMLGRVLQHFHDASTTIPEPGSTLETNRGGVPERLRVQIDQAGVEVLSALWSALGQPYRLSAGLTVDVVAIDSAEPARVSPRAGKSYTVMRRSGEEATT